MKDKVIIDNIQKIREKNNRCWMDLLRIAVQYAPKESRELLKKINDNDRKISEYISELSRTATD